MKETRKLKIASVIIIGSGYYNDEASKTIGLDAEFASPENSPTGELSDRGVYVLKKVDEHIRAKLSLSPDVELSHVWDLNCWHGASSHYPGYNVLLSVEDKPSNNEYYDALALYISAEQEAQLHVIVQSSIAIEVGMQVHRLYQLLKTLGYTQIRNAFVSELGTSPIRAEGAPEQLIQRPQCQLLGQEGNIFNLLGIAIKCLRKAGQKDKAKELATQVFKSTSYNEAIKIISEYVDIF